jgi:hypothetical protein
MAPAVAVHSGARPIRSKLMDKTGVPQERLLYASYFPPHLYEDGTDNGQPIVTALFQELTESRGVGYAIREYSLVKGEMVEHFPKSGRHSGRAVIRQEWYREIKMHLPDWVFEGADSAS